MHGSYSYDITHNLQYNMSKMLQPTQGPIPPPDACSKQKLVFFECSVEEDGRMSGTPKETEDICFSDFVTSQSSLSPTVEYGLMTDENSPGVYTLDLSPQWLVWVLDPGTIIF